MIDFVRKLISLLDTKTRTQLFGVLGLILIGTLLDMFSIAMFLPMLQLAVAPDTSQLSDYIARAMQFLNISETEDALIYFGIALVIIFFIKNAILFFITYLQFYIVHKRQAEFSNGLLEAYFKRSYSKHLMQNSAEIMRNVSLSSATVFVSGLSGIITVLMEGLLIIGALIVLFWVQPVAAMTACVVGFLSLGVLYIFTRLRLTAWGGQQETLRGRMMKAINEGLSAFKEMRVLHREAYFIDQFSTPNREAVGVRTKLRVIKSAPRMVGEISMVVTFVLIVAIVAATSGKSVVETLPVVGVFAAAALRIMPSANRISAAFADFRSCIVPLNNIYADLQNAHNTATQKIDRHQATFERDIVLQNVSYQYPAADRASLTGISCRISKGYSVGIVGPTGAGKSTFSDIVMGLIEPRSGKILVDDIDIADALSSWQKKIGYVPQSVVLTDATIRSNIAFGVPAKEVDNASVERAIDMAQIRDLCDRLPDGDETVVGERGVWLSGGERQRIGIARAIYHDPELIVFDEATSSLDNTTERKLTAAIEGLRGVKTLIVIAHRLSTVARCDTLLLLDEGRLVAEGSFEELSQSSTLFSDMASTSS